MTEEARSGLKDKCDVCGRPLWMNEMISGTCAGCHAFRAREGYERAIQQAPADEGLRARYAAWLDNQRRADDKVEARYQQGVADGLRLAQRGRRPAPG